MRRKFIGGAFLIIVLLIVSSAPIQPAMIQSPVSPSEALASELTDPLAPSMVAPASYMSSELVISAIDAEQRLPAVAYNSKHHEYLVVWHNTWAFQTRDIRARRISRNGAILAEFSISDGTTDRAQPAVAYDPMNDRYLVVWITDVVGDGSDWDIYGRFIPWDGPDPTLGEFPICTWNSNQWNARIVYAQAQAEFLVVWTNTDNLMLIPAYISARRVYADGSGFPSVGSDLTISDPVEHRLRPDITYNLARNEYLLVWENASASSDIYGLRLTGTMIPLGGGPFGIATWPDSESFPSIAACHTADQYLVVWQSKVGTDYDIYARFISGDGVPASVHTVQNTGANEEHPRVASLGSEHHYLIAWEQQYSSTSGPYGVWAREMLPDQSMLSLMTLGHVYTGMSSGLSKPVVAGGSINYLTVWERERMGTSYRDIHGRITGIPEVFLPLVLKS